MMSGTQQATQVQQMVWTVAPSTDTPFEFGRWMGASEMAANAALWYASTTDMIDYLCGWLEAHGAQDAQRRAAQGLFEQLTIGDAMDAAMDGLSFYGWNNGVWFKKETGHAVCNG